MTMPPATGSDVAVRLEGLTKLYGDVTAVDGIDLEIRRGEFFSPDSWPGLRSSWPPQVCPGEGVRC